MSGLIRTRSPNPINRNLTIGPQKLRVTICTANPEVQMTWTDIIINISRPKSSRQPAFPIDAPLKTPLAGPLPKLFPRRIGEQTGGAPQARHAPSRAGASGGRPVWQRRHAHVISEPRAPQSRRRATHAAAATSGGALTVSRLAQAGESISLPRVVPRQCHGWPRPGVDIPPSGGFLTVPRLAQSGESIPLPREMP